MTFLPIAERELRVAARRSWTYWTRVAGTSLVTLIAGAVMGLRAMEPGAMGDSMGKVLLSILEWLIFVGVMGAGVFLTADALSEEKREGTLGLLFLTDLRGHDVALGKLTATSLRAAQGLLAVFPVLGLSLLLGGVSWGEFWRVVLALCNTLFFSLTLGLFVSSISRDALKAITSALAWTAAFLFVPLLMDAAVAEGKGSRFEPFFSVASPGFTLSQAGSSWRGNYGLSLAVTHALGWVFLGLTCLCVPRAWQQRAAPRPFNIRVPMPAWLRGSPAKRAASRARALECDPVAWLAGRELWLHRMVPAFVYLLMIGCVIIQSKQSAGVDEIGIYLVFFYVISVPFGLWVAAQACRFFTEARRTGLLELLLATPLTGEAIVRGYSTAARQIFLLPLLALMALLALGSMSTALASRNWTSPKALFTAAQTVQGLLGVGAFVTGLLALASFGVWMGLTSRNTAVATLKTVLFVKVLPWLVLLFMQGMMMMSLAFTSLWTSRIGVPSEYFMVVPSIMASILQIGCNLAFMVVAHRKVKAHFREYVALGGRRDIWSASALLPPPVVEGVKG